MNTFTYYVDAPSPLLSCCPTHASRGIAQNAGSRAKFDGGGVWSSYPVFELLPGLMETLLEVRVPVAELEP